MILMICKVEEAGRIIGIRLFDTKTKDIKNVPYTNILTVLSQHKGLVSNLDVVNGKLEGTNGVIDRYAVVNREGKLVGKSPLVIINRLGDLGYTIVNYLGKVRKVRVVDVVKYAKEHGIANGKVVTRDGLEFISAINGEYEVEELKIKTDKQPNINIGISVKNNSTVAKHTGVNVEVSIDDSDVFKNMTEAQKKAIKDYYIWYTVDKYKSLAKSVRLSLAVEKAEKLAELRGETEWEFGGIEDMGFLGGGTCELGHNLRYAYYAQPSNKEKRGLKIIFGETCSADFFKIAPEDMKNLVKTRKIMSDEIQQFADMLTNNEVEEYMNKLELLYGILKKLQTSNNIINVFGKKVGQTIVNFIKVKLPIPMSLALEISKIANNKGVDFWKEVFPEHRDTLDKIYTHSNDRVIFSKTQDYLMFLASNRIEGAYAYNPLDDDAPKRRDVGDYNKNSRHRFTRRLSYFKNLLFCRNDTVTTIDSLLEVIKASLEVHTTLGETAKLRQYRERKYLDATDIQTIALTKEMTIEEAWSANMILLFLNAEGYSPRIYTIDNRQEIVDIDRRINNIEKIRDTMQSTVKDIVKNVGLYLDYIKDTLFNEEEMRREAQREDERMVMLAKAEEEKLRKDRLEREEKKRQEEAALKSQEFDNDKLGKLKKLMDAKGINKDNATEYADKVALNIIERGDLYEDLTIKRKWRIDERLKAYSKDNQGSSDEPQEESAVTEVVNNVYLLTENEEVKGKVDKVIENKEKIKNQLILKIAYSIIKSGKATDKQMKYIDKGIGQLS